MEHEARIRQLEVWQAEAKTTEAVRSLREEHIEERFDRIEATQRANHKATTENIDAINAKLGRVVWLIIAALIGGLLNFIVQGGLNALP